MEDYVKRQIDMIGQMLMLLAKKLRLIDGDDSNVPVQDIQDEIAKNGFDFDIATILSQDSPVAYMVDALQFSDEALETFTQIVLHSDCSAEVKDSLLNDAISYLDNKGFYSFALHSYQI